MKKKLASRFEGQEDITLETIRSTLEANNYCFKKISVLPERRNLEKVKNNRRLLVQKLVYALHKEYEVIFVDEASLHFNESRRYAWGQKGKKIPLKKPNKSKNYSLLAAITDRDILGCQLVQGGVKKEDFAGFISSILEVAELGKKSSHIVLFLDNASIHHSKLVKNIIGSKLTLLFNAEYSPMLNPIEEFFSKMKATVRQYPTSNEDELVIAVQSALKKFKPDDIIGYTRHTLSFVQDSLHKIDLI